ncbi:MAG: PH domain-containing protein [Candidatus Micrarchaeota archaeon]
MAERPSLRAIIFWMRRPLYMAVSFTIVVVLLFFFDRNFGIWGGLVSGNAELEKLLLEVVWVLAAVPFFFMAIIRWLTTTHMMDEKQFIFSRGILNRKKYVVNYEHIQNINVDRSFFELMLKLSTVRIETAGVKPGESELEIEGLSSEYAEKLVKQASHLAETAKANAVNRVDVRVGGVNEKERERDIENLKEDVKKLSLDLKEIKDSLANEKRKKDWGEQRR